MARTILDIHILQTVPPSNLNRDDTGSPKSAMYGGVRRARVSSQAWKRATRKAFGELLPPSELGVRTKKVADALAERVRELNGSLPESTALELAAEMMRIATGSKIDTPARKAKGDQSEGDAGAATPESAYLMFLSTRQLDALAELTLAASGADASVTALKEFFKAKENKLRARQAVNTRHSVDICLFGRMVADSADLNVEAATQVAHAISVHASEIESDYFTAVDDRNTDAETGAGMIGSVDFNSATLYRYAAVDVDELHRNLGAGLREDESPTTPVQKAVSAFVEAFITSLPTGKINTFGNHTLPSAVVVKLRTRRPISFVGAFEEPVWQDRVSGGFLRKGCERLAGYVPELEKQYDLSDPAERGWVFRVGSETKALSVLGSEVTLKDLLHDLENAVAERLGRGA
ncbi:MULTISPECIES: type I-E CRISPR-associated protein Cas7/Cse4/CasC [Streptomyces]|uniref:type I-E CRISPR-associated protein Cas7/Cse4/CasC n=1 Tax=Streptomyces TaxID=1883 RepID=UPI00163BD194|nr:MULTISPECIES: type I-E CRISPR-associated protein Cas7/Cse4/CasC [Streptomyces]MBC2876982.1 type I-E CRISPR-associated protein Cas7/Cse4/CasC [Streptomyces sp. TYQ1024]UBI36007.1 type I-E CRISPR-associated protein Cas7/Cse4/CasC [Streptomyces mobaraensis]UKW28600.1 type I-E CRISPR-associated protein Cas7/Cse4/CasC [Streptomyces sp. TYQ1024]